MTLGRHQNVICLQEVIRKEENHQVYFVLDIMDLSLEDTVKRMAEQGRSFTKSEVKSVWFQCFKGLRHVHKVGLVHCDLAARNILVDRTGSVKITDFGLAIREGENVFFSQKEDLIDLIAVFINSVSQEEVDQIDLIHGKISSSGVQLVEQLYSGEVSLLKAIKSCYFRKAFTKSPAEKHHMTPVTPYYNMIGQMCFNVLSIANHVNPKMESTALEEEPHPFGGFVFAVTQSSQSKFKVIS
ncbi:uncharacterized protein LOC143022882 [Oratosquilla oratoria]|uniref:uncharacterized protein LOC143022882 n=1 Tax=Oratosquilla oratoria TaxID=337810 RepID=UPI003F75FA3E